MKKALDRLSQFIVRHKILLVCVIAVLAVLSVVAIAFVNVNSDIFSYLPDDMKTKTGLEYIKSTYGMDGDALIGVSGIEYSVLKDKVEQVTQINGVNDGGVMWLGSLYEMKNFDINSVIGEYNSSTGLGRVIEGLINPYGYSLDSGKTDSEGNELKCIKDVDLSAMVDGMLEQEDVKNLFFPQNGMSISDAIESDAKANYVVIVQLGVPSSSDEAMDALKEIDKVFADYDYAIGGSTKIMYDLYQSTINEVWKYVIVAVLVIFIILMLTTDNLVEPFVLMLTLGVAVLLNMGTNIIFPSVSVVTFAASSILQIGLSMDYAIFLIHAFKEEKQHTLSDEQAMRRAIPKTFSTITASSLTTVGGFIALLFMRFGIGQDLGLVLAKGVFLSLVTIILLLPCLLLYTRKLQTKTTHAVIVPKLTPVASFSIKKRRIFAVLLFVLIIPSIIIQSFVKLSYVDFSQEKENPTKIEQIVDSMSNSIIIALPVSRADNSEQQANIKDNILRNKNLQFIADVKADENDNIIGVLGLYSIIPEENYSLAELLCSMMSNPLISSQLPDEAKALKNIVGDNHALYFVMVEGDAESAETAATMQNIYASLDKNFKGEERYVTGMTQAALDLKEITPTDFLVITLISVAIIFVILLCTMKSFKISALIILVIEFGIFVNLSLSVITGSAMNFIGYIIISSIQLGATVDYAILFAVKYKKYAQESSAREAAFRALNESALSVLTSVAIMAGCCLSVYFVSTNLIVQEIVMLIARGSIISGILVFFVLPSVMILFTGRVANLTPSGKREAKAIRQYLRENYRKATRAINERVRQTKKDIHDKLHKE